MNKDAQNEHRSLDPLRESIHCAIRSNLDFDLALRRTACTRLQ